jgi:type I restriction enzyme S subunit
MSKKKKLIPELRFPEFKNEGEWEVDIVDNLVSTITPPRKLTSSDYQKDGKFPIIDQSKSFYCGWTNDVDAVIKDDLPLIIFGDHTCILKITNKPFVQGADGIKILKTKNKVIPEFLYQYLQYNEVKQEDYKRHFSILKEKSVLFPKKESGEQQKIASCLSSLDDLISAHSQKLDLLKDHKKGLMQNLFPQEGEKVPKLRFKEFEKDGEWNFKKLNKLGNLLNGLTYSPDDVREEGLLVLRSSNVQNGLIDLNDSVYVRTDIQGANLLKPNDILICVRNGSKNLIGKNAIIPKGMPLSTHGAFMTVFRATNPEFVFQLFQTDFYDTQVKADLGATINSINGKNFLKYEFPVPENPKEQQKIASCLSSLDALITAQAEKIEQLKQHKKGLMQGLFPKIND